MGRENRESMGVIDRNGFRFLAIAGHRSGSTDGPIHHHMKSPSAGWRGWTGRERWEWGV